MQNVKGKVCAKGDRDFFSKRCFFEEIKFRKNMENMKESALMCKENKVRMF